MTAQPLPRFFAAASLVALVSGLVPAVAVAQGFVGDPVVLSHRDKLYDVTRHGSVAYAVGYPGLLLRIEDRGERVSKLDVQTREALFAIDIDAASSKGVVVGRNCTVLTSDDAGKTWHDKSAQLADACQGAALLDVAVLPGGRLVAVGELGTIVTSDDGGKTWKRRAFDFTLPAPAPPPSPEGDAADAGVSAEGVVVAPEAAAPAPAAELTAEQENEGAVEEARLSSVAFADAQKGFIAGEFGLVLATTDGGATWKRQRSETGKLLFSVAVWGPSHALAVGAEGAVIETTDGGATWATRQAGVQAALFGVEPNETGCVVVGEHGLVLWRNTASEAFTRRPTQVYTWLEASELLDAVTGFFVGGRGHLLRTRDGGKHFERLLGQ